MSGNCLALVKLTNPWSPTHKTQDHTDLAYIASLLGIGPPLREPTFAYLLQRAAVCFTLDDKLEGLNLSTQGCASKS